jgi:haloalkane dehalogenase
VADEPVRSEFVRIDGRRIHYLEAGSGPPVLLLHGFPTSSHLYRDVLPQLAPRFRAIAPDLPGFGRSEKPLDVSYSFRFYDRFLEDFARELGLSRTALVVHDLGGPIGLYWAAQHPERLTHLALLNTLVYPETSWAVKLFVLATYLPGLREFLSSPTGIAAALRLGVAKKERLSETVLAPYQDPFREAPARKALLAAGHGLHPKGFREIADWIPRIAVPVYCLYGERDRILPDVAQTMQRVQRDVPQAKITSLPDCGHFLQEDAGDEIGRRLADFLS